MNVRRKMSIIVLSLMTTGIFAGCAGGQLSQDQQHNSTIQTGDSINKEAELQAEIDALREELDELKNNQADQVRGEDTAGQTDQGNTSQNKAINSENPSSKGNSSSSNEVISIKEAKRIALARVPEQRKKICPLSLTMTTDGMYMRARSCTMEWSMSLILTLIQVRSLNGKRKDGKDMKDSAALTGKKFLN